MNQSINSHWNEYLNLFPDKAKDIYFTEEYLRLYEDNDNKAECFIYEKGHNIFLMPYLKRRIQVLKDEFYDLESVYGYGGPLANTADPDFIIEAFDAFFKIGQASSIVAGFIRFHPIIGNHRYVNDKCQTILDRKTVAIDLTFPIEQIWDDIHSKHRNVIRKAEKSGLVYKVDENLDHLDEFVRIYNQTMDFVKADNYYYFKNEYYSKMKNLLNKHCFLGLVYLENILISGSIFFQYGPYGHYHLSGSLKEFLPYYPNNFLLYQTALYMKQKGLALFHLGGGNAPDEENSLYKFKKRFSKTEFDFYLGKIIFNQEIYEQACQIWEEKYPANKEKYNKLFLKYRYIN